MRTSEMKAQSSVFFSCSPSICTVTPLEVVYAPGSSVSVHIHTRTEQICRWSKGGGRLEGSITITEILTYIPEFISLSKAASFVHSCTGHQRDLLSAFPIAMRNVDQRSRVIPSPSTVPHDEDIRRSAHPQGLPLGSSQFQPWCRSSLPFTMHLIRCGLALTTSPILAWLVYVIKRHLERRRRFPPGPPRKPLIGSASLSPSVC